MRREVDKLLRIYYVEREQDVAVKLNRKPGRCELGLDRRSCLLTFTLSARHATAVSHVTASRASWSSRDALDASSSSGVVRDADDNKKYLISSRAAWKRVSGELASRSYKSPGEYDVLWSSLGITYAHTVNISE